MGVLKAQTAPGVWEESWASAGGWAAFDSSRSRPVVCEHRRGHDDRRPHLDSVPHHGLHARPALGAYIRQLISRQRERAVGRDPSDRAGTVLLWCQCAHLCAPVPYGRVESARFRGDFCLNSACPLTTGARMALSPNSRSIRLRRERIEPYRRFTAGARCRTTRSLFSSGAPAPNPRSARSPWWDHYGHLQRAQSRPV